jgi:hypothetical protein
MATSLAFPATLARALRPFSETQETSGEEQDCAEEGENGFQAYSDEPQGQRDQPDEWNQRQRQQSHRPAEHKKNAPGYKKNQGFHFVLS